MDDVYDYENKV